MYLRRLEIQQLRSLERVSIAPSTTLNVIAGPNGSGKTSLLEGIYLIGHGRSFRSRSARDVIAKGAERLSVFGEVVGEDESIETIGLERARGGNRIKISGQEVRSASKLARELPLLLITPDSQRLLSDGARLRRRMLDWALFHVEPTYHALLQRYRQALRQRNAQLRVGGGPALHVWDEELAASGEQLHQMRMEFAADLRRPLGELIVALLGHPVEVVYDPGWDTERALVDTLSNSVAKDVERGFTGHGPHRADVRFEVGGVSAQHVLSRGESKLFVAAILLAQTRYVAERAKSVPVLLVDDLASELDADSRSRFLAALRGVKAQTFLTTVSFDLVSIEQWELKKMFHVERGKVQEMV